jgi:hypothetical protein
LSAASSQKTSFTRAGVDQSDADYYRKGMIALGFTDKDIDEMLSSWKSSGFQAGKTNNPPQCFVAGTLIDTPDGGRKPIEAIAPGDMVMAFDLAAEGGRGRLVPARIRRVFRNLTTELLVLSSGLVVTLGHLFLNERGSCQRIDEIIARGGRIVRADGRLESVDARKVVYCKSTRGLYEEAEDGQVLTVGALALRPEIERGWRTYNFEVERLHTYVASGYRVHNDSLGDMISADEWASPQLPEGFRQAGIGPAELRNLPQPDQQGLV